MDRKSGYPYRAMKNGLVHAFPQLVPDAETGGGAD